MTEPRRFWQPGSPSPSTPTTPFAGISYGELPASPPHHVDAAGNILRRELFAARPSPEARPGFSIFGITFTW
jgi:hypothetical protein